MEVVYKRSVLKNRVSEDNYLSRDLAHRVREVAYSVLKVIYKMSVLKSRVMEELYLIRHLC